MTTDPILENATDEQLGLSVEENVFAMFHSMTQALDGEIEEYPQLSRFHAAPRSPIFKGACRTKLPSDETDTAIRATIDWFKSRDAAFFFWWMGNDTQPRDLGERLESHGLAVFEKDAPAMVADINQLNRNNQRPPELRLHPVADDKQLLQWKQTFIESFGIPEFAGQAWVDATGTVGIGKTPWHLLLGTLNAEVVCCGLLHCGAGVAGLLGLGTLSPYRGRGIGSAMQLERLRIARELGHQYAVLFASEMGHSAYLKLGFRDTGRYVLAICGGMNKVQFNNAYRNICTCVLILEGRFQ